MFSASSENNTATVIYIVVIKDTVCTSVTDVTLVLDDDVCLFTSGGHPAATQLS